MSKVVKKTTIGGQALFEGVLMKGSEETAIVVRKPDGELESTILDRYEISKKYKIFKYPFFRGIGVLYDAIRNGTKAIDYSVSFLDDTEEKLKEAKKSKLRKEVDKVLNTFLTVGIIVAFLFIFFFLPTWVSNLFKGTINSIFVLNLIEAIIRIILFLLYVILISQLKDIKRVFQYHGAEHMSIACYEHGEDLVVENVKKYSPFHPRCGTSFLFNMVILSAFVLAFLGWPNPILRFIIRILIIPILMGITYELNLWIGKHDNVISRFMSKPGLFVQYMGTARQPSDDMIEVAIASLKMVIPEDENADVL